MTVAILGEVAVRNQTKRAALCCGGRSWPSREAAGSRLCTWRSPRVGMPCLGVD